MDFTFESGKDGVIEESLKKLGPFYFSGNKNVSPAQFVKIIFVRL